MMTSLKFRSGAVEGPLPLQSQNYSCSQTKPAGIGSNQEKKADVPTICKLAVVAPNVKGRGTQPFFQIQKAVEEDQ